MSKNNKNNSCILNFLSLLVGSTFFGCQSALGGSELASIYFSSYCDPNPNCEDIVDFLAEMVLWLGGLFFGFIIGTFVGTIITKWVFRKLISVLNWWFEET